MTDSPLIGLEVDCGCGSCRASRTFAIGIRAQGARTTVTRERDRLWTRNERWERDGKTRIEVDEVKSLSAGVWFLRVRVENDCWLVFGQQGDARYSHPISDVAYISVTDLQLAGRNGRLRDVTVRFNGVTSEGECHLAARPQGAISLRVFFLEEHHENQVGQSNQSRPQDRG